MPPASRQQVGEAVCALPLPQPRRLGEQVSLLSGLCPSLALGVQALTELTAPSARSLSSPWCWRLCSGPQGRRRLSTVLISFVPNPCQCGMSVEEFGPYGSNFSWNIQQVMLDKGRRPWLDLKYAGYCFWDVWQLQDSAEWPAVLRGQLSNQTPRLLLWMCQGHMDRDQDAGGIQPGWARCWAGLPRHKRLFPVRNSITKCQDWGFIFLLCNLSESLSLSLFFGGCTVSHVESDPCCGHVESWSLNCQQSPLSESLDLA